MSKGNENKLKPQPDSIFEEVTIENTDINSIKDRRLRGKLRAKEILRLKVEEGKSYGEIAYDMGISEQWARELLYREIDKSIHPNAHIIQHVNYQRREWMLRLLTPDVKMKDKKAMALYEKIMNDQERLTGADAPKRSNVQVSADVTFSPKLGDQEKAKYIKEIEQDSGEDMERAKRPEVYELGKGE